MTYSETTEGGLFLAIVLDLHSRKVVGRAFAESLHTTLPRAALHMALGQRRPALGLLHHSDRSGHYASAEYRGLLSAHGLDASLSRTGNPPLHPCAKLSLYLPAPQATYFPLMKTSHFSSLGIAIALVASTASSHANRAGSRTYEGNRGGSVTASGASAGRFSAGSVSATGPNGATYNAGAASNGRTTVAGRTATGVNGNTYSAAGINSNGYRAGAVSATGVNGNTYSGYRTGYIYTGGVYRPATVTVNSVYVAPTGACAGWGVIARPYYISYPYYATHPVEVSVQVELIRRKYYSGTVDGQVGPGTRQAISQYQAANNLPVTGAIDQALVVSRGIAKG